MKKAVILLLILSLCLSLCACGEPQVIEKEVEVEKIVEVIPEKYQDLINALEAEDYDGAQAALDVLKPVPETPPIKEVTITTENFFDYFEYVEFPEYNLSIQKDSAGNLTGLYYFSGYYLKEGYTVAEENRQDCKVEAGVKYNYLVFWNNRGITVDLENRTYTVTGRASYTDKHDETKTGYAVRPTQDGPWSYYIDINGTYLSNGKDSGTQLISDLELVSASGTLYLYE